jgi:hypothetical protein
MGKLYFASDKLENFSFFCCTNIDFAYLCGNRILITENSQKKLPNYKKPVINIIGFIILVACKKNTLKLSIIKCRLYTEFNKKKCRQKK